MAYQNKQYKNKKDETPNILGVLVIGIFKIIWWLVKLPFKGVQKKNRISQSDIDYIKDKKSNINSLLLSENIIELQHAVIEADKLVDYTMKCYGYEGLTFADRLRSSEKYLDKNVYNSIWLGHKTRNRIAHEENLSLNSKQLKDAAMQLLIYLKDM